uniref:Kynurenine 3-monooxygenase n=1 Tax=Nonomuraea gerenzanensis TaxID=93944 RepID=A0A1M4EC03_9ACTN|nr:Kynurenine 3-monooxygenase [Nonomuraea gerenzanensis]
MTGTGGSSALVGYHGNRPEGQEMRQLDRAGTMLFHHIPEEGERFKPEIDRSLLRDLLLDSLQPGTVRWGHTLQDISGPAEGPRLLHFAGGATIEADPVIGADGAWSKVRRARRPGQRRRGRRRARPVRPAQRRPPHPRLPHPARPGRLDHGRRSHHRRHRRHPRPPPGALPRLVAPPAPADHRQRRPLRRPPDLRPAPPRTPGSTTPQ